VGSGLGRWGCWEEGVRRTFRRVKGRVRVVECLGFIG
jgi:hypothetical protein